MANPCACGRLHADDMDVMAHALADHIIETACLTAAELACEKAVIDALAKRGRQSRRPNFAAYYAFLAPYEARFKRELKVVWKGQQRTVISNLRRTPTRATDSNREDVARFNQLFEQWAYPSKPARKQIAAAYRKVASPLMIAQGHRTADELSAIVRGRTPKPRRSVKAQDVSIAWDTYNNMIDDWLNGYMIDLADEVDVASLEDLKRALQVGWQAGESIPDLVKRVDSVFTEFSRYRSELIARTESIRASAQGSLLTYEASGVVDRSMWVYTPVGSEKECEICGPLNGQVVALGDPFPLEDDYGDGGGPPAHPNCRCCLVPILADEEVDDDGNITD
jgi:SPP1 gp7 family putative phage head morphogenesis protein